MARRRSVSWAAVTLAALLSVALLAAPCEGAPKRGKAQAPPPPPPPPPPTKGELFKQAALQLVTRVRTVVVPAATAAATHGRNAALAVYKGAGSAAAMAGVHMRAVVRAAAPVLKRTWDRVGQFDVAALHAKATPPAVVVILALLAVTALQRRSGATGVNVRRFVPQQALLRAMLAVSVGNVMVPFAVVAATSLLEVAHFVLSHPLAAACLALALNCVPHVPAALATALAAVRSRMPKARASVTKAMVADETAAPMQQRISSSGDLSTPGKAAGPGSAVAKPPTPLPMNGGPKKTSPGPAAVKKQ